MSSTPEPLRFVYGRWRIDTPEVESCENIPELEGGKQRVKMNSMKRENDNMNLPRSKSVKRPEVRCQNIINIKNEPSSFLKR